MSGLTDRGGHLPEDSVGAGLLSLFDGQDTGSAAAETPRAMKMTGDQRLSLRDAFSRLGVTQASAQFDIVYELTGQRIAAVSQLQARHAHLLLQKLEERIANADRSRTGDAWADREEDTWIDNL